MTIHKREPQETDKNNQESTLLLEDKILKDYPDWDKQEIPPIFKFFMDEVIQRFYLPEDFLDAIETHVDHSSRVGTLVMAMRKLENQEDHFLNYINVLRKPEEEITAPVAVRMYGVDNTKILLSSIVLWKMVKRSPFVWDKITNHPKVSPEKIMKYAIYCEKAVGDDIRLKDVAYMAGFVFDFLDLLSYELISERRDRVSKLIEKTFRHGLLTATIGKKIVQTKKEFPYAKYFFPLCILHDLGKIVLSLFKSEYFKFLALLQQRYLPRGIRFFAETERNSGMNHAIFGSLLISFVPMFSEVSESILFHHEPYLLRSRGKEDLYRFTSMICLATNIANNFHLPRDSSDPILNRWIRPELHGYDIDVEGLVHILRDAAEKKHH